MKPNTFLYSYSIQKRQSILLFFLMKSSDDILYFGTCILPDYVAHESLKEFWTNIYFENMRAGFHRRSQNSLRFVTPKWCIFSHEKKIFSPTLCLSSWSNLDFNILSAQIWPSWPQFCEKLTYNWQNNKKRHKRWTFINHRFSGFFFQNWKK